MKSPTPLISWHIRCFNKKKKQFFNRELVLDTPKITQEEFECVLAMAQRTPTDPRIRRFRPRFREVGEDEFLQLANSAKSFSVFTLPRYFEDEDGNPLGEIEVLQVLTGQAHPIIVGNPESVLRLGPSSVIRKDQWSVESADKISHFLVVVRDIAKSRWLRSPLSMKFTGSLDDIEEILSFDAPDRESIKGVILGIRQLYSSDNVFNIACGTYLRHVADDLKKLWVKERKDSFNRCRENPPHLLRLSQLTTREILDVFIYGSDMMHPRSKKNAEQELKNLLKKFGRERVVMAFNRACLDLCRCAFHVYPVVKQDFAHWVRNEDCAGPGRVSLDDLLP